MIVAPLPNRIYLLRHAKSGWALPGQKDFDRTLNAQGSDEAARLADLAANRGYRPELVISSTAARCRQTADAIRCVFPVGVEFRFADSLYNSVADAYLELLKTQSSAASVMLVGHNPAIEETLEILIGSEATRAALADGYPTAGLAVLELLSSANDNSCALADFLEP